MSLRLDIMPSMVPGGCFTLVECFYILNGLLLLSGLAGGRMESGERRLSLVLIQTLLGLPLLAGEYLYLVSHFEPRAVRLVLFSEIVFAFLWLSLALRLGRATVGGLRETRFYYLAELMAGAALVAMAACFLGSSPLKGVSAGTLDFHKFSPVYFSAAFVLLTALFTGWRIEAFWRALNAQGRWEYKFMVVGIILVCGAMAWSASCRLAYLLIVPRHLQLLSLLLIVGWLLMASAVGRHRLLNRRVFVSRKVIYSSVIPSLLAAYLLGFGGVALVMRTFGLELSFVLTWLFISLGAVAVALFAFSGKMRRRVHYFISTHFYINKYEYRDEWLAFSQQLQGARTEADVVRALRKVLAESLYTTEIFIWLGCASSGYRLVSFPENPALRSGDHVIASNDPLVGFFEAHSHFHLKEPEPDRAWEEVAKKKEAFLASLNLKLIAPISINQRLAGLICLGPEYTGGLYGHDDFDLLTALGGQAASALMAVRMAEKLAHAREQRAWTRLSAFVLHDIKNAATMLSLLQENAPEHIHEPEFQQDMLALVDDALMRIGHVEQRLRTLKGEITPVWQRLELCRFLNGCRHRLKPKLASMEIHVECRTEMQVNTDPELLFSILENLLLNAFEAGGAGTVVQIRAGLDGTGSRSVVEIIDNGPGIAEELLPDALFEPFRTTKSEGSGIGLWQVQRVATSLGGRVVAGNTPEGNARFFVTLPLDGSCSA